MLREKKIYTSLEYWLSVKHELCANLRKQLCSGGRGVGLGWEKTHGRAALVSFCSIESSHPNPRCPENATRAQGPFQNKRPLTLRTLHSQYCPAVKEDPLNLFFPQAIQLQLCTLTTNACYVPLGAPARRKRESYLPVELQLQGYFFSPLFSGYIHTLEKKTRLAGVGERRAHVTQR